MSRIIFVVPYLEMEQQIRAAWQISSQHAQDNNLYNKADDFEYDIVKYLHGSDDVFHYEGKADVIVGRGATALGLRQLLKNEDIHIIEVSLSSSDLIAVTRRAIKKYGNLPIAITGTYNMTYGARGIIRSNRYNIQVYQPLDVSNESYEVMVRRAKRDGCQIVIGGVHTVAYAREIGLHAELLTTSVESMLHAVSSAKSAAVIATKERKLSLLSRAIIENSYSGILSYNENLEITTINDSAYIFLGKDALRPPPSHLSDIISPGPLLQRLSSNDVFVDQIIRYRDSDLIVSKVNLAHSGDNTRLATFQDAAAFVHYLNENYEKKKGFSVSYIAEGDFASIVGSSPRFLAASDYAKNCAQTDKNVLITGEAGVGKSALAQAIHSGSKRHRGLFMSVDCSTLTYEKLHGTHSDGSKQPGIFELASSGTLLLREVDRLSPELQAEVLAAITEKRISRSGTGYTIPIDLRVISTCSRDLAALVSRGEFNSKLYYSLSTFIIEVPPLRERADDIPLLMAHYFQHKLGKPLIGFTPGAENMLLTYKWPGNIHELYNSCERLALLPYGHKYNESDILGHILHPAIPDADSKDAEEQMEKRLILEALADCGFSRTDAAEKLGLSRTTLWRKLKKYGLTE